MDDAFTANRLDLGKWDLLTFGEPTVSTGAGVRVNLNGASNFSSMRAFTAYQFSGDFDVQVDFTLDSGWNTPFPSGETNGQLIGAGLVVFQDDPNWMILSRARFSNAEGFSFNSRNDDLNGRQRSQFNPSNAASGSLRIVSSGGIYRFSCNTGTGWIELASTPAFDRPVRIALQSANILAHISFTSTFRNFKVNSGTTDYKPYSVPTSALRRSSFLAGGQFINEAIRRWNSGDAGFRPMELLAAQGMTLARGCMTNISDPTLASRPASEWRTLGWKESFWSSREMVAQLFKDAMAAGMRINACYYLSDGPADAGRQNAPAAWKGLSVAETEARLEQYSFETTSYLKSQGIPVDLYDPGNEILTGILNFRAGDRIAIPPGILPNESVSFMESAVWPIEATLLKAAIRGIRRADPGARIVLHVETSIAPGMDTAFGFFRTMQSLGVPFDVAGLSLPYADSTDLSGHTAQTYLQRFDTLVNRIAALGLPVYMAETSYPAAPAPGFYPAMSSYPYTNSGQAALVRDLFRWSTTNPNIIGLTWFYPEWFPGVNPDAPPTLEVSGLLSDRQTLRPAASAINEAVPVPACTFSLSGTEATHSPAAGDGTVRVSSSFWCRWTAASDVPWISFDAGNSSIGNGALSYSVAANTSGGIRNGTITVGGQAFRIRQAVGAPVISTGGVVIHAGASSVVSPGSLFDIYGASLAPDTATAPSGSNWPTTLGNVRVLVNGTAAPIFYISATQIIAQIPASTALGPASVVVSRDGTLTAPIPVTVQASAPFILTYGANQAIVQNQDMSLNGTSNAAQSGSVAVAYLMGSGPLTNTPPDGAPALASPLSRESLPVSVTVGGVDGPVSFAGLTPGFVGLVQINFQVPNLAPGNYPMQVRIGSAQSNTPSLSVRR